MASKRHGKQITWRTAKRNPPKIPAVSHITRIKMPDGTFESWSRIHKDYNEQIEGLGYSRDRISSDLEKKRAAFDQVAQAAALERQGYADKAISKILGFDGGANPVRGWLASKPLRKLPPSISSQRHEYHQRSRKTVTTNLSKKHELGYAFGIYKAGRLIVRRSKETGHSRFSMHTNVPEIAQIASHSARESLGLSPSLTSPGGSANSVYLGSANLPLSNLSLPTHPESRLGFTRAMFDLGNSSLRFKRNRGPVHITHSEAEVMDAVSQTLTEHQITHERDMHQGQHRLRIPYEQLPRFKREVGFRDPQRQAKLPN